MILWFALGAWLATSICVWRYVFRYNCDHIESGAEFVFYMFLVTYTSVFFGPFIVAYRVLCVLFRGTDWGSIAFRVGGESRDDKVKRLEREAKERERRIERLEYELLSERQ